MPAVRSAGRLRRRLQEVGFGPRGLGPLLGERDPRLSPAEQEALWLYQAAGADPLAVLVRLFLLQQPVPWRAAGEALTWDGAALEAAGLVRRRGPQAFPLLQLSLHGELLIASDPLTARPWPDYVQAPTTASLLLDRLAIPSAGGRALDLGTGTGFLALRLAARGARVTASDLSPRALAFARFNAALNGVVGLTLVRSDAYAQLPPARFDRVLGNLPFVLSPRPRFVYRDAGQDGAGGQTPFLARVVAGAGARLAAGGLAQFLAQWPAGSEAEEEERFAPWLVRAGCDALVLRLESEAAPVYAARWSAGPVGVLAPAARARSLRAWVAHFRRAGIAAITTGLVTLRRRRSRRHFLAFDEAPPELTGAALGRFFAGPAPGEVDRPERGG